MKFFLRWLQVWTLLNLITLAIACSASWIPEAQNIIQVLVPAINAVISLLVVFGVSIPAADLSAVTEYAQEATNDLSELASLIDQYNLADTSTKPGILAEIDTAAKIVQSNLSKILPALHISSPATVAKVTAVVGAVLSEIEDLIQLIPTVKANLEQGGDGLLVTLSSDSPHPFTAKQFKKVFNQAMSMPTGNSTVDSEAAKLVLK